MTLLTHLATGTTTTCRCWGVTRRDGRKLGFTDHDRDLAFAGFIFRAGTGLSATVLEQTTGMAVDNAEAMGALSAAAVTAEDLRAGRYDDAEVEMWLVNWADPSERLLRFRGTIGEVSQAGQTFRAELRGLTEILNRPVQRVFQRDCTAVLGDAACRINLDDAQWSTTGRVLDRTGPAGLLVEAGPFSDQWFAFGRLTLLDGAGAGLSSAIRSDVVGPAGRLIELTVVPDVFPAIGDRVQLQAGCDRSVTSCQKKFNNFLNFRGFPDLPGEDWLTALPMRQAKRDGSSRK